jgi:DNA-binding response OmpR family regulator
MVLEVTSKNPGNTGSGSRFLMVVDGDAGDLFSTSMLLQRFSYKVCTAMTVDEALAVARVALPALFIAELPPGMSSFDLMRRFRQDARTAAVPVIIKTSDTSPETGKACRGAGAFSIRKPVQAEELFHAVQLAIEDRPGENKRPREHIRIYTRLPMTINNTPLDRGTQSLYAVVMSEDGMYVRTLKILPQNALITMQIVVKDRTISLEAVVLYSHGFGEGTFGEPGMGIRFTRIAPGDKELLRQFIVEEVTKGLTPK